MTARSFDLIVVGLSSLWPWRVMEKREWDPEDLVEQLYDVEKTPALFEESNRQ